MNKKQRIQVGAIIEIIMPQNYFTYAHILNNSFCAFFDYKSNEPLIDLTSLNKCPVMFTLCVYNDIITHGHWLKVGKIGIRDSLRSLPMQFIQDTLNPLIFSLYNPNTGVVEDATKNECRGLERASVWDKEHVEDRIDDYYNNRSNYWAEQSNIIPFLD